MTLSGLRALFNNTVSIYFLATTLAGAFVAHSCAGTKIETDGGVFRIRDDKPAPASGRQRMERHEAGA